MVAILQTTFSNKHFLMKITVFWLKFRWRFTQAQLIKKNVSLDNGLTLKGGGGGGGG